MAIRVVCSICGKRARVAEELKGGKTPCAKCGGPITVPFRLSDLDATAEKLVKADTATMTPPDGRVSSARWNKWSLAAARESWTGRRQRLFGKGAKCETQDLFVDDEPRTVYTPKALPRRSRRVVTIGCLLLILSVTGVLLNLAAAGTSLLGLTGSLSRAVEAAHVAVAGATFGGNAALGAFGWSVAGLIGWRLTRRPRARRRDEADDWAELDEPAGQFNQSNACSGP